MNYPPIIAVAGYAGAGKDTAADHLAKTHGYVKVAWADKLREAALALNPIVGAYGQDASLVRYADLVTHVGYQAAKNEPWYGAEVRSFLQRLGTEVGRDVFGQDFWVDLLMNSLDPDRRYVIPDTRFPNEALAVHRRRGVLVRISRPDVGPANDHPSETALDGSMAATQIVNGGTVEDLGAALDEWLEGR